MGIQVVSSVLLLQTVLLKRTCAHAHRLYISSAVTLEDFQGISRKDLLSSRILIPSTFGGHICIKVVEGM